MSDILIAVSIIIAYNLIYCAVLSTSFVPDEYYQYVEPAYRLVYGIGIL